MEELVDKLPVWAIWRSLAQQKDMTSQFGKMEFIIDSMTPKERANPDILNGLRNAITRLWYLNSRFKSSAQTAQQMGKMMKKMKGKGMQKMMRGLGNMMPPGAVSSTLNDFKTLFRWLKTLNK